MATKNKLGKYQCPCCFYFTFDNQIDNTFEICPVCGWEDDGIQLNDINYKGGANTISLSQAMINFENIRVSDPVLEGSVRSPLEEEFSD